MAGEWRETTLVEGAVSPRGTVSGPFGSTISKQFFVEDGVPVIRGNNLSLGTDGPRFHDDDFVYLTNEKANELASAECQPGDLVFTARGTIGQVGLIPTSARYPRYILSANQLRLRPDPKIADALYLYYWFSTPEMVALMQGRNAGSALPNMNLGALRGLPIVLPPLPEQRAIAHILGTLDDKIELNRRMNETLEAMARALFKSWFVDFEPVRAKAGGRDTGLPTHLADLFPDRFEDSELGEIPAGWEVKTLGDLFELAYGRSLKADNRQHGTVPVYGSNGQVGWHDEKLVAGPGIVVGRKGNPGTVTWSPTDFFPIDTTFYVVPKRRCRSLYFLFHALRTHDLESLGADSAVPGLNRHLAYMNKQVAPTEPLLQKFDYYARALFERVHQGNEESRTLAALRDALLPKLLSGEIRVRAAGVVGSSTP